MRGKTYARIKASVEFASSRRKMDKNSRQRNNSKKIKK